MMNSAFAHEYGSQSSSSRRLHRTEMVGVSHRNADSLARWQMMTMDHRNAKRGGGGVVRAMAECVREVDTKFRRCGYGFQEEV
jgi:hypothetical protein